MPERTPNSSEPSSSYLINPSYVVMAIGTDVEIAGGPAKISGVTLLPGNHIQYRVTWSDGGTRRSEWVEVDELTIPPDAIHATIGFRP